MGIAEKHLDCMSVGKELLCKIPRGDLREPSRPRPYSLQRRLREREAEAASFVCLFSDSHIPSWAKVHGCPKGGRSPCPCPLTPRGQV